ncbi:MAG: chromosome segregation protein SMC [Deltaproteobacteria bacterium]|nr:chromosome segregation protein SMC [Deltaproteobacteria bacterium]
MKIKELDILGFKSFVERTTLTFQPGITAIVGPNGCGKSNIVDAIRWVMGEQSPRHLRGKDMEDVIFGGSESRKSLGMAEVSILFSNEDGNAPEDYREFGEIMVTRRLFRSGESEYLINKVPCRLKDITELFMGTGVGTRAYSIVEQGQIGLILNSKPQERRFLIEEAAGITKYKSRKKEALSKMESTRQNLQRVNDIVGEVKRQMNALDRQARKAERFRGYRAEAKETELKLHLLNYLRLAEALLVEEEKLRAMEGEGISMETRARGYESEIETLKGKLMVDEKVLNDLQERFYALTGDIQKKEDRIEYLRSRRDTIEKQGKRSSEELEQLKAEGERAEGEIKSLEEEIGNNRKEQAEVEVRLSEKVEELESYKGVYEEKGRGLEALKGEMVRLASELAHARNNVSNLEKRIEETGRRIEKSELESEGLAKRVSEVQEEVLLVGSNITGVKKKKDDLVSKRDALFETINSLKERRKVTEQTLRAERDGLLRKSSHLHSLEALQEKFEGYSDGVKAVKLSENGDKYTVVSDIFETAPEFETALEAALEGRLQHLLVADLTDGLNGISFLKSNSSGRCGFINKSGVRSQESGVKEIDGTPLLDKVIIKPGYEEFGWFLLGNTYVVNTIEDALSINSQLPTPNAQLRFVTLEGDVVEPAGVLVGGSNQVSGHGILQRKREMKGLREEVSILKDRVQEMEEGLKEIIEGITDAESDLESVKKELHQADLEAVHLEKDRERHADEINRLTQRLEVMRVEGEYLSSDRAGFEKELLSESDKLRGLSLVKEEREENIGGLQEGLLVYKGEMDRVNTDLTDLKVAATSLKGRQETLKATIEKVIGRKKELLERASLREKEMAEGSGEMAEVEAEIYDIKKRLNSILAEKDGMEERMIKAREVYQAESEKIRNLEGERHKAIREFEALRKETNSVELTVSRLRMEIGNISAKVGEGHNISMEEVVAMYKGHEMDEAPLSRRHEELCKLIEELGEVNLTAIEEYQGLEERYRFLTDQQTDLNKSLESLQTAIQRINAISRERFQETFEAVNANFKTVFQRLFKGGKAEMVLTDTDDLLEAGIDIIAQPPGKKLQGVSLLSGGEKALTAVSLIFSIFLLKPTPFCLLDEVDAPLDDANVARFNSMVLEMSDTSQFILITHNKMSMEIADVLYGITMQEPGVSRLVSVRLQEEPKAA